MVYRCHMESYLTKYREVRTRTEAICRRLKTDDYIVQPIAEVSPPKWHLGHTTWFFETFLLGPYLLDYNVFDPDFSFVFNSYYETVGARILRTDRGNLSRPSVDEVYRYRAYVDSQMELLFQQEMTGEALARLELGLNHEQQHQELLLADIKYIFGHNPLFPSYIEKHEGVAPPVTTTLELGSSLISISEGVYEIGFGGDGFCFDNEKGRHKVFLHTVDVAKQLVTNREYLEFIADGGYQDFRHWHAEGWDWVNRSGATAPLYWHLIDDQWMHYTLSGLCPIVPTDPVRHINFYEASAYAHWKGMRLPTEAEWEIASDRFEWGTLWEWTGSAYLPYPGFAPEPGAIGEYNGKFMVNQMVLRGASVVTAPGHSRSTYRNFFHPHVQWQFTGLRLAAENV